jgi:hypothetical protein
VQDGAGAVAGPRGAGIWRPLTPNSTIVVHEQRPGIAGPSIASGKATRVYWTTLRRRAMKPTAAKPANIKA